MVGSKEDSDGSEMRIQILASAIDDLANGRDFYELQESGVGDYFQDCLFSDVESLLLYGGMHRIVFGYHRLPSVALQEISLCDLLQNAAAGFDCCVSCSGLSSRSGEDSWITP